MTVTDVFAPFTMSPVMKASLVMVTPHQSSIFTKIPQELVFKVYDRKFAPSFRKYYRRGPPTYESEASYLEYISSGKAPQGLEAITQERNALYYRGIRDYPPELLEHMFSMMVPSYFHNECAAYERLSSLQGQTIPTFCGTTRFLDDSSALGLDISVQGILLEFVPGVNLCSIDPSQANLGNLVPGAIHIFSVCGDMGVLNKDVRMENFIVKFDGSGLAMVDFAQSRLRGDSETDEEWRRAKMDQDEESAIGYMAQKEFGWEYVPSNKYRCPIDDAYWASFNPPTHSQKQAPLSPDCNM